MFSPIRIGKARRPLLLALAIAALAAAPAHAQHLTPTAHSCQEGGAPLPGGASTNPASGAGLVARGWEGWCSG